MWIVMYRLICWTGHFCKYNTPCTGLNRPWGFWEVEGPRFPDNQHMDVVRLSALCTGDLYPSENIPGINFFRGSVNPRATVWPKGLFFFLSFSLLIGWQLSIWNCCKPFFSLLYSCQLLCFWWLALSIVVQVFPRPFFWILLIQDVY